MVMTPSHQLHQGTGMLQSCVILADLTRRIIIQPQVHWSSSALYHKLRGSSLIKAPCVARSLLSVL